MPQPLDWDEHPEIYRAPPAGEGRCTLSLDWKLIAKEGGPAEAFLLATAIWELKGKVRIGEAIQKDDTYLST